MLKQTLHTGWTVKAVNDLLEVPPPLRGLAVPAKVPGCIHTDLLRAEKILDPYKDLNEFQTRWIGMTDWEYSTTFDADEKLFDHERIDLACEGLDTVATITLNGNEISRTQNMHRSYRFDVKSVLRRGSNELKITFASPVKFAEENDRKNPRPYVNGPGGPFNAIRKMSCNFGWDWGPALPTCGIWRGIRMEAWSVARLVELSASTIHVSQHFAVVRMRYRLEFARRDRDFATFWAVRDPRGNQLSHGFKDQQPTSPTPDTFLTDITLPQPQKWWPSGHGGQPLYEAKLIITHANQIDHADEETLIAEKVRFGLRTVELDTSPDDIGRKFVLKVNGKPIFCKGFNWIPDDCFLDRACEPTRVRERIQQAIDAGGNMLRVWGGGIFETDDFYNICDELGVLVWQDFLFACAMYAEEPLWDEVEAEARDNVARLAHHPSLAIWNGCNENIWAYRDWGWKDHANVVGKTWGKGFYFDLLPQICKELTPTIPYWAGSPWSGDYDVDNGVPPNAATHGNKHVWEAWFKEDYAVYRKFEPRFCSEFGFQGPAPYSSIAAVLPEDKRDFGSLEMRHRQQSGNPAQDDGDRRNLRHLIRHFNLPGGQELLDALETDRIIPKPEVPRSGSAPLHPAATLPSKVNFDDLHYLLSVNQSRALTLGVEWFRSRQPTCMGTLYWQLNDCWPGGTTWSCIDGDGKPKLLWYATRKFFADRLMTIQPEQDGSLHLCIINDTDALFRQSHHLARRSFDGNVIAEQTIDVDVPPRSLQRVKLSESLSTASNPAKELITVDQPSRAVWFFLMDRELQYPKAEFEADLQRLGDVYELTIKAKTLLREICVFADRLDPDSIVGEQLVTLLPGESFPFVIHSKRELRKEDLIAPMMLRCVNAFGTKT